MIKQLKWEKNIVDDNNRSTNESHLQINTKNIKKQFEVTKKYPIKGEFYCFLIKDRIIRSWRKFR